MADNLIFPIGFDLEEAVKKAGQEWNSTYADKLEKLLAKRAITVNLGFSTKNLNNLDDVKRRLAELKIEPLTPENKTAIRDLVRELKELARIMEKIQKFKGIELPELQMAKAAKLRKDVAQADEKLRLSQERVRQSEERLILSQQRAAQQAKNTGKAFGEQERYLSNLIKKMAVYASFSYVGTFLTSVREVTAQFELQRVSLGAILQDANKGAQIFSQIKQFALKSPISILDLTKYTKQLAAYKIGYDELFDTTKRLADVSVGLGVDFQRIVLLYGQVRATGYLRASEVRQATEAGIPLVEELAAKLTKANGELVTAADVMDMISKRAISFDMVKDVFTDMTSAGGAFYQMQEKQGNTLYGLWAKLGDAASVMYEQIGNTGIVNEGMKEAIQMLTELMRNWKAVGLTAATTILPAVAAMAAWKMATKALAKSVATATSERIAAEVKLKTAMKGTDVAAQNAARSTLAKAKADEAAAIAAQKNATAQSKLKMGFISLGKTIASGLGIGIAVMLVTNLIYKFYEALTNFRKLNRELGSIYTETATLQDQSVRNFEFLADKAVKAASGSKEQTDALQELNRTYRDILPQEALTIENLTKMKGKYDALTQSIREYVAEQQKQKAESAIMEYYGTKIRDAQMDVRERLFDQDLSANEVGRFFAEFEKIAPKYGSDVWGAFRDAMIAAGVKDKKRIAEIWKKEFEFSQRDIVSSDTGNANIRALTEAYADQANELKGMNEQYRESIGNLGKFADMQKRVSDTVANATYKTTGGKPVDIDKQGDVLDAMKLNLWVKQTASEIQNNEDIKKAFAYMGEGIKSEWFSIINVLNSNNLGKVSQINFDAIIASVDSLIARLGNKNPEILAILNTFRNYLVAQKKEYENMAPSETVVVRWQNRWRAIVKELQISGQNMNRFLMQSGEDFEAYRKRIKEEVVAVINTINVLNEAIKARIGARAAGDDKYTKEQEATDKKKLKEAQERKVALEKLLADLNKIEIETGEKEKGSKGSKSDTRLQVLQEVAQTLATINKEYDDLAKKEGASKALADIKERFKEVLAYTNKIGGKFGLKFDFPTEFKTLQEYRNAILKVMQSLKGLPKGSEKTILDFKTMIGKADSDYLQKEIEKQIKALSDRISRTKTAKEFYEKILEQTGDVELAANVAVHIYGEQGKDLNKQIREQTEKLLEPSGIKIDESIFRADGTFDPKKLREFAEAQKDALGGIESKAYQELIKLSDNAEKDFAKTIEGWLKAIEKAKSASDKMLDLARTTRTEIDKITAQKGYAQTRITELLGLSTRTDEQQQELENLQGFLDVADKLIQGFKDKQTKEQTSLAYEMFKDSPMYVQMFDDLDNASGTMLSNMKAKLLELQSVWGSTLNPTQLKELQSRLSEIDAQLAKKNPFKTLSDAMKQYRALSKGGTQADAERKLIEATDKRQAAQQKLNMALDVSRTAQERYNEAVSKYGADSEQAKNAKLFWDAAKSGVEDAGKLVEQTGLSEKEAQRLVAAWKKVKDAIGLSLGEVFQIAHSLGDLAGGIGKLTEVFGGDEEDVQYWNDIAAGLNEVTSGIENMVQAAISGNPIGIVTSAITAIPNMISGFANLFSAGKVRRANKEIKRQQELLDQLEYTYGRLEKAADKAFGADFVSNQKQQQKILLAQQQAYMAQYDAEMSKGKKADEEKAQEYLNNARSIGDQIADMQGQIAAQMLGTDLTSAARDFAKAWLEAYKQFGNTADAMSEKFHEMVENMVVESLLAKVMERALKPAFDMIDTMGETDFYSESFWKRLMAVAEQGASNADRGAATVMSWMEKMGIDMKELGSEYTGIAKDIAGATSEEINTAAAIGNTLMYYVSPIPRIDENLARVVAIMEGRGASAIPQTTTAGWTDWQQQAMDNYMAIQRNTAETVVECRRAADACERMTKLIRTKGSVSGIPVFLSN